MRPPALLSTGGAVMSEHNPRRSRRVTEYSRVKQAVVLAFALFGLPLVHSAEPAKVSQGAWVVTGRVVDEKGTSVEGATVRAATGLGTLLGGGSTKTDSQGRYTLHFGEGVRQFHDPVSLQVALFFASKLGMAEKNLSRQGNMMMARQLPDPRRDIRALDKVVVLPGVPQEVNFVLGPAATLSLEFLDADGKSLERTAVAIAGGQLPPGSSVLSNGLTDADGACRFGEIPVGYDWWFTARVAEREETRSLPFKLPEAGAYWMRVRFGKPDATGRRRLEIESIVNALDEDITAAVVGDDPLLRAPLGEALQARGREILARVGEVNRYWLGAPPEAVKGYQYDFRLSGGRWQTFRVAAGANAHAWVRHGLSYTSSVELLTRDRASVVFRLIEEGPEKIRLAYSFTAPARLKAGNGVQHDWFGYFDGPLRDGILVIDARRFVPLENDSPLAKETFDDYAAIGEGHFAPRRVHVEHGEMKFDWTFRVYEPGLWLFSSGQYPRIANGAFVANVENVIVNEAPAKLAP